MAADEEVLEVVREIRCERARVEHDLAENDVFARLRLSKVVFRYLVLEWKLDVVAVAIAPLIIPIAGDQLVDRKQAAGK